uniref:Uncharacterized protein n=1 Tax=Candidatus Nitrotoga fabula TaxID=2182327 RepID=A0A2X0QZQ6_9PROT|nr:protein of unknown function [Candidatus Nitrotoga fabula]
MIASGLSRCFNNSEIQITTHKVTNGLMQNKGLTCQSPFHVKIAQTKKP